MRLSKSITAIVAVSLLLAGTMRAAPACGDATTCTQDSTGWQDAESVNRERPFPLMVGDPPPALTLGEPLSGEPIDHFEAGRIYVIHLWANWCAQTMHVIPYISELQEQYKDQVTMLGVMVLEYAPGRMKLFMNRLAGVISFPLVRDDVPAGHQAIDGKMAKGWLDPTGQGTVPLSFIIDRDMRLAWIGYSLDVIDPLAQVVDGTWDTAVFAGEYQVRMQLVAQAKPLKRELESAIEYKDWKTAVKKCAELLGIGDREYAAEAANGLERIAATIASLSPPPADLDIAFDAAYRANELTGWSRASTVGTLARIHYARGDSLTAVELMEKAVSLADFNEKQHLQKILNEYNAARER
ncbi:MAG: TlpA disulfide reductase family protein [Candidatus Latescibacterota bacterium]